MEWQHPEALYFILPLGIAWAMLTVWSDRLRQRARESFAAATMWSRIFPPVSRGRFWGKLFLREVAIITGLIALAGPRYGVQYEEVIPRGSDLYVLIDVSRSMLADDVPPSRLGRAKADVSSLVNRLDGERIGLIAFAGQAVVKCPLTVDYDSFRRALDELDPDSAPRGGTAIGDAIRKAVEVFHAKSERDQAILLITDGDDQQSYPLEAAEVAAERHVTIFTIGLGDSDKGARIPQKANAKTYVEYHGEQVWSKLDSDLLGQIALKTSGVYIPAGTRSYDLGELYENHLQGRRSTEATGQQRIRRSERFQLFLAIALFALLLDASLPPFKRHIVPSQEEAAEQNERTTTGRRRPGAIASVVPLVAVMVAHSCGSIGWAADAGGIVREGLRLYRNEKFNEAQEKFASAAEELEKQKSKSAAIAAFDEACALHRKGDIEKARELYLRAGLTQEASIAIAAHFNLGTLSAEEARKLCGEKPELVPVDQREKILGHLKQAVDAYRHCLELKPDHSSARRNLELVRQWIKYYTDRWRELDRQKRRDESDLLKFLEYLVQTQTALRATVTQLSNSATADQFVEFKRVQSELREEIPTLREKIAEQLRPQSEPNAKQPSAVPKEVEEGILMLQGWADTAGQKMEAAERQLGARDPVKTVNEQQLALDELDRIWEAVVPFHPLLTSELSAQTAITKLVPAQSQPESKPEKAKDENEIAPVEEQALNPIPNADEQNRSIEIAEDDLPKVEEIQSRVLKRARLLAPKAEAELKRLEEAPPQQAAPDAQGKEPGGEEQAASVDPEEQKEGYRKAIELSPKAVEAMEAAVKSLHQKDRTSAGQHADEARRILEEIQKAQPKNKQQQNNQNDQQKQQQNQNQDQEQNSDQNQDQDRDQKDDQQKKDDQSSDKKEQQEPKPDAKSRQGQVSKDRIEDALRKVRERQQEKRERDKKRKAQFLGKGQVDKDW